MGKRYIDVSATELKDLDPDMSLDQGLGTATNDMRVVWSNGTNLRYLDIYVDHPTSADASRMSEAALTVGGGASGLVRVNYEDTHGSDRILYGMRAIREELEIRGRSAGWLGNAQMADDVIAALRHAERCFASRGRAEGHCAANG